MDSSRGALDWICKHCVENLQGGDMSATGSHSRQPNYMDEAEQAGES